MAHHSKAPYRNTYVIRFDIAGERIVQILEYALDEVFLALEVPPGDWTNARSPWLGRRPTAPWLIPRS